MAALLLTIISPSASHNPLTCYGDAREDYYKQSSNYDPYPTESDLPFVADKCQRKWDQSFQTESNKGSGCIIINFKYQLAAKWIGKQRSKSLR